MMRNLNSIAKTTLFATLAALSTACNHPLSTKQQKLTATVDSFATYYYNWHFHKARNYVTDDSEIWLRYVASQVSESDLEMLNNRSESATCETVEVAYENDSTAVATILVRNHLHMDSIGKKPVFREESMAAVPIVYRAAQKRWLISLSEPLRDEK